MDWAPQKSETYYNECININLSFVLQLVLTSYTASKVWKKDLSPSSYCKCIWEINSFWFWFRKRDGVWEGWAGRLSYIFSLQHAQCDREAPDGSASVRFTPVALRRLWLWKGLEDSGGDHWTPSHHTEIWERDGVIMCHVFPTVTVWMDFKTTYPHSKVQMYEMCLIVFEIIP